MRCGVIDLGSSTFHSLVGEVDEHGVRDVVFDRSIVLRLGEHTDTADGISELVNRRGIEAVHELLIATKERVAAPIRIVATGALRDTVTGRRFVAEASARVGEPIELLPEHDEARLTWLGVSAELAGSHGRLAVLDLGGGSLEAATGMTTVTYTTSVPLGVLRLKAMSPTAIRDVVELGMGSAFDALLAYKPETIALSSGTARTLLRVSRRLGMVAKQQRHVPSGTFLELARRLPEMSSAALLDLGVSTSRLDTIATGAAVFAAVLARLAKPVIYVASSALREGVLIDQARRRSHARFGAVNRSCSSSSSRGVARSAVAAPSITPSE
jgi:exopolyphosphatase/guanosine-5'-triphosphate,3'-diphosphate pyrophosphatase